MKINDKLKGKGTLSDTIDSTIIAAIGPDGGDYSLDELYGCEAYADSTIRSAVKRLIARGSAVKLANGDIRFLGY